VLLAVDSYHAFPRLKHLDAAYRLRTERCKDGFVPGEAAVAILLEPPGGPRTQCLLGMPGTAREPASQLGELSSTGRGLQQAIEAALGSTRAAWVLCDLNGESYRSFEWGIVRTRMAEAFASLERLVHPADCVGDVGSATGALLVACVAQAFARGYAPANDALLFAGADDGARAALVASRPQ
jgi:3-oxoacyl-[acyl-carrier-protein] synthase-1